MFLYHLFVFIVCFLKEKEAQKMKTFFFNVMLWAHLNQRGACNY